MFKFLLKVVMESLKDRQTLIATFIAPSLAMLLIGFVIATMGVTDVVKLGIVNDDQGLGNVTASAGIIQSLRGQDNLMLVYLSQDELDQAFKDREIDGAVVFGKTFTSDLVMKKNASLGIVVEGTDQAKAMAISSAMTSAASRAAANMAGAKMQLDPAKSPITVVPQKQYGSGLSYKEFAVASIIGLISFVLPCMTTMVAVLGRKGRDSRPGAGNPGPGSRAIAYLCAFGLFGLVQVLTVMAYVIWYVNASFAGDVYSVAFVQALIALAGVAIGILIAAAANDYVQAFTMFIPAVVLQMLFGGLMVPVSKFPWYAQALSEVLPYTYASEAVKDIILRGFILGDVWMDCTALVIISLVALALSYFGLRSNRKAAVAVAEEQPAA